MFQAKSYQKNDDEALMESFVGRTAAAFEKLFELYRRQAAFLGFSVKLSTTKRYTTSGKVRVKYFRCSAKGSTNSKENYQKHHHHHIRSFRQ